MWHLQQCQSLRSILSGNCILGRVFNVQGVTNIKVTNNFIQGASLSGSAWRILKFGGSTVLNKDLVANTLNGKQPFSLEIGVGTPGWDIGFSGVGDKDISPINSLKQINRNNEAMQLENILQKNKGSNQSIGNILDKWHQLF